jgi:hypothetical protein
VFNEGSQGLLSRSDYYPWNIEPVEAHPRGVPHHSR